MRIHDKGKEPEVLLRAAKGMLDEALALIKDSQPLSESNVLIEFWKGRYVLFQHQLRNWTNEYAKGASESKGFEETETNAEKG